MKTLVTCLAVGLAAGFVLFYQQLQVLGRDDFRLIEHSTGAYKVFTYGFPFKVNDCKAVLDGVVHPSPLQTPFRLAGNFLFFFLLGLVGLRVGTWIWKRRRTSRLQATPGPRP